MEMTKMNKKVKKMWVDRLKELPPERQGKAHLYQTDTDQMCCLGVLCEIAVEQGVIAPGKPDFRSYYLEYGLSNNFEFLPIEVIKWAGLNLQDPQIGKYTATQYNDNEGKSFVQIANLINRYL